MRKVLIAVGFAAAALAFVGVALTAPSNDDELLKDEKHFLEQSNKTYNGGQKGMQISNMEVVAHEPLGNRGFNGDVWAHDGYAYIGHWGFADWANRSNGGRFCPEAPNNGVAVVRVGDGTNVQRVATLENPPGTSAEDVVVYTASDGRDIAAAGLQWCGGSRYDANADRGLMLWDVTTPEDPVQIGYLKTACCTRGVHEFEVEHHANGRTYAYATVPTSRYPDPDTPSGYRDANGDGDFRMIDITDPAHPVQVSDWGIQDAGGPFSAGQGCDADPNYGHGAEPSADGRTVFLSYWGSGFIALDVSNPANPVFKGRTVYPANADGDAHSSNYDDARKLLFTADEDFCKNSGPTVETGLGYLRIYDYSNLAAPTQIGSYRTPNSLGASPGSGDYSIHNAFLVGTDVYASWYSDGVRVIDASNPRSPSEVAYFVPPAAQNPVKPSQRGTLSQTPQVWGVVVADNGLVYASDMNSGLWVLRRTNT